MAKRALIVVDLQNEYKADGKLPLEKLDQVIANAERVIGAARDAKELVVNIRHETPGSDDAPFAVGAIGTEIIKTVAPIAGEAILTKHYPNSFRDTGLKALLDDSDVTDVVIIGAMSHMCIDATARAAFDLGYGVTVVGDACATMALSHDGIDVPAVQVQAAFMAALAFTYAQVVSTAELLSA